VTPFTNFNVRKDSNAPALVICSVMRDSRESDMTIVTKFHFWGAVPSVAGSSQNVPFTPQSAARLGRLKLAAPINAIANSRVISLDAVSAFL
jgi:hypothetical protein